MKIVIIGSGIAGPTLALLLQGHGHEIEIYDRDATAEQRAQTGWSFSIRNDSGLRGKEVLQKLGLWDTCVNELAGLVRTITMVTTGGSKLMSITVPPKDAMLRIHRGLLRCALLDKLPPSVNVHWNTHCVGYKQTANKAVALLADGSEVEADLIVGADGTHSQIRNQMKGDKALPHGTVLIMGTAKTNIATKLTKDSVLFTLAPGLAVFYVNYQYKGDNMSNWGLITRGTEEDFEEIRQHKRWKGCNERTEEVKAKVLQIVREYKIHDVMPRIIEETPFDQIAFWTAFERNPVTGWHDGRVVLMGDAAHATTPFAGAGANMALEDALVLTEQLNKVTQDGLDLEAALTAYEKQRAKQANGLVLEARRRGLAYVHNTGWSVAFKLWAPVWVLGKVWGMSFASRKKKAFWGATVVAVVAGLVKGCQWLRR
eukprot:TRINITY_DN112707_c0_g1_i1.p1 TRINITY_DN112707_c0_g1~~TRINITY_DN112707_c0_g1_i1.p1  ORF type:complete len:428 (+),score=31.76 TRINITY_DN112707_c0_g1_i1:75-1358(+)